METLKYRKSPSDPWQDVVALVGPKGEPGDSYVLTEDDKSDIAALVVAMLPLAEEVSY